MLMPLLDLVCPLFLPFKRYELLISYIAIRFKLSPFFQTDQAVSNIAECPGMRSQSTAVIYVA
jgi:hypothetical protein